MEAFSAGTLAGTGSFRCGSCGFAIALQELDEVPSCPECGGHRFARSSLFTDERAPEPEPALEGSPPWLAEAREKQASGGHCLAFEEDGEVHLLPLDEGWTRVGRSLAAQVRFDDPTVSRRHALVYRDESGARMLDDRSLNGVFCNGERVEHTELKNGDEIAIGRFRLHFMEPSRDRVGAAS